jgi:hypothetical protein
MQLLIAALPDYPEITLFLTLTLAIGFWFPAVRFGLFGLGVVIGTLVPEPQFFPALMK